MPIQTTFNLTPLETAAIDSLKADGTTAEEYLEANNTTQEQLDKIVKNFVTTGTLAYASIAENIVVASIEAPDKLTQIQPHIDAIKAILGMP